ncbi:MAG: membrane protein insertion efficiency factor YidD [Armatimonadota bacterium]
MSIIWLIRRVYQPLSRRTPPSCRFYPTCSEYAAQALGKYGLWRGTFLTIYRIVRCNPWNQGGIDPVPEKPDLARSRR